MAVGTLAGAAFAQDSVPSPAPERRGGVQVAQFNTDLLFGGGAVDASRFRFGNPVLAGDYRVDINVNGDHFARETLRFVDPGNTGSAGPCLSVELLQRMGVLTTGIVPDATGCVDPGQISPDASYRFNDAALTLDLGIPQVALSQQPRGYVDPALWDPGVNAATLGYSLSSFRSSSSGRSDTSNFLGLNAGVNVGAWRFRQYGTLSNASSQGTHWNTISAFVQRDLQSLQSQLTIGDTFTTGDLFDSMGFRGVRIATDDRMLPQSLRGYAPIIRGVANSQARVEVRQNNNLIYQTTVAAGDFAITDLYSTGYGGDLEVTITESDGSKRSFRVPYASVAQLLRPGYNRVSATVGQLRDMSLSRKPYVGEVTWQRGLTNTITGYTGAQATDDAYQAVMGGVAFNTPVGAVALDSTYARARIRLGQVGASDTQDGTSTRLTYTNNITSTGTNFTLAAYRYSTKGFLSLSDSARLNDLADRSGPDVLPDSASSASDILERQKQRLQLNLNQTIGTSSAVFFSGSTQNFWNRSGSVRQFTAGFNHIAGAASIGLFAARLQRSGGQWDNQIGVSVSVSLGPRTETRSPVSVALRTNKIDGGDWHTQGSVGGTAGERGEFGYSANAGHGGGTSDFGVAGSYSGSAGNVGVGYSRSSGGSSSVSANASGALVAFPGGVSLAPSLGETVGVVEAKGAAGARLTQGTNVSIGRNGYAVVPYLSPYQSNEIALDPSGTSLDFELKSSSKRVAPTAGAVVKVAFEVERGRAMVVRARMPDGRPLPFGADVYQGDTLLGAVGQGSRMLVRVAEDSGRLSVKPGSGVACAIDYALPPLADNEQPVGLPTVDAVCQPASGKGG
ncbi:fimbria/pilus outer membrane usher protein [Variovorax sp. YR216]|uniref:fimbria/pilus outer membrane usher protein n=1 Tax=Variovorax sp. YR216 TaxID=1882828 RepID=UPI0015A1634D|nr:fimbria/pilus outer membrane usher protein [Variovorax sp. YR216]